MARYQFYLTLFPQKKVPNNQLVLNLNKVWEDTDWLEMLVKPLERMKSRVATLGPRDGTQWRIIFKSPPTRADVDAFVKDVGRALGAVESLGPQRCDPRVRVNLKAYPDNRPKATRAEQELDDVAPKATAPIGVIQGAVTRNADRRGILDDLKKQRARAEEAVAELDAKIKAVDEEINETSAWLEAQGVVG